MEGNKTEIFKCSSKKILEQGSKWLHVNNLDHTCYKVERGMF